MSVPLLTSSCYRTFTDWKMLCSSIIFARIELSELGGIVGDGHLIFFLFIHDSCISTLLSWNLDTSYSGRNSDCVALLLSIYVIKYCRIWILLSLPFDLVLVLKFIVTCASRFHDDLETEKLTESKESHLSMQDYKMMSGKQKLRKDAICKSMEGRELSRVFSEDYDAEEMLILDPRGPRVNRWNKIFLVACLISLFVDPLFFYLPVAKKDKCIDMSTGLEVSLTIIRSMVDAFYIIQIYVRFQTAYIAPSSRVSGRGELIIDLSKIASNYLHKDFWLDLVAAQPLPQVCSWYEICIYFLVYSQNFWMFVMIKKRLGELLSWFL